MLSGEEYIKKAQKQESKWVWKDHEKIFDYYQSAGKSFKYEKKYELSANAFMKAGDTAIYLKNTYDAIDSYNESSNMYNKIDDAKNANIMKNIVLKLYLENNQLSSAGKIMQDFAEQSVKNYNYNGAIDEYLCAIKYYEADDKKHSVATCLMKLAVLYVEVEKYIDAVELYEKMISQYNDGLTKFKVKEYQFYAFICKLATICSDNIDEQTYECEELLETYSSLNPTFLNSIEYEICNMLLSAVKNQNESEIDYAVGHIGGRSQINIELLTKITDRLKEQTSSLR